MFKIPKYLHEGKLREHYYMSVNGKAGMDKSKAKLSFTTVNYYEQCLLKSSVTIDEVQNKLS